MFSCQLSCYYTLCLFYFLSDIRLIPVWWAPLHWRPNGKCHGWEFFVQLIWQIRFYRHVNQNFRGKKTNFADKMNHKNSFFARVLYLGFGVSKRYFCQWQDWNSSKLTLCGESTRLREVKQFSCDVFFFNTLPSFGHYCVPMHTNLFKILCFSCQWKGRDIVYQRICLFFG